MNLYSEGRLVSLGSRWRLNPTLASKGVERPPNRGLTAFCASCAMVSPLALALPMDVGLRDTDGLKGALVVLRHSRTQQIGGEAPHFKASKFDV